MYAPMSPQTAARVNSCATLYLYSSCVLYLLSFTMPYWDTGFVQQSNSMSSVSPNAVSNSTAEVTDMESPSPTRIWRYSWEYVGLGLRCVALLLVLGACAAHLCCGELTWCPVAMCRRPVLPVVAGITAGVMGAYGELVLWFGVQFLAPNHALVQSQLFCISTSVFLMLAGFLIYLNTVFQRRSTAHLYPHSVRRPARDPRSIRTEGIVTRRHRRSSAGDETDQTEHSSAATLDGGGGMTDVSRGAEQAHRGHSQPDIPERDDSVVVCIDGVSPHPSPSTARRHASGRHETVDRIMDVQSRMERCDERSHTLPEGPTSDDSSDGQREETESRRRRGEAGRGCLELEASVGSGTAAAGNDNPAYSSTGHTDDICGLGGSDLKSSSVKGSGEESGISTEEGCTQAVCSFPEGCTDRSIDVSEERETDNSYYLAEGFVSADGPTNNHGIQNTAHDIDDELFYHSSEDQLLEPFTRCPDTSRDLFYNSGDDRLLETFIRSTEGCSVVEHSGKSLDNSRASTAGSTSRLIAVSQKALMLSYYGSDEEYHSLSDKEEHSKNQIWP